MTNKASQSECKYGWIGDTRVCRVIREVYSEGAYPSYALIVRLDSSPEVASVKRLQHVIGQFQIRSKTLTNAILIDTTDLLGIDQLTRDIFVGFDEVYLFESEPDHVPPPSASITSEIPIIERPPDFIDPICQWMSQSGCLLALGDGYGVNYVTTAQLTTRHLRVLACLARGDE